MDAIKHFFTVILYQPLLNGLIFLAWLIPGHSIGWAIIVLTILIRLALAPGSIKTLEQQRKMRALQPKLDELKATHGHDRAAHSQAMMELYAAEKVSPFGSCLPTLIQLPVLLVLYRVFIHGLDTSQFNLLYSFTPHMSTINTHWFGLDLTKPERWILPIVAAVLQFIAARQLVPESPKDKDKAQESDVNSAVQKQMMYLSPLITVMVVRSVPAALGLYWVTFSLTNLIQQTWVFSRPGSVTPPAAKKGEVTVTIRKKE